MKQFEHIHKEKVRWCSIHVCLNSLSSSSHFFFQSVDLTWSFVAVGGRLDIWVNKKKKWMEYFFSFGVLPITINIFHVIFHQKEYKLKDQLSVHNFVRWSSSWYTFTIFSHLWIGELRWSFEKCRTTLSDSCEYVSRPFIRREYPKRSEASWGIWTRLQMNWRPLIPHTYTISLLPWAVLLSFIYMDGNFEFHSITDQGQRHRINQIKQFSKLYLIFFLPVLERFMLDGDVIWGGKWKSIRMYWLGSNEFSRKHQRINKYICIFMNKLERALLFPL